METRKGGKSLVDTDHQQRVKKKSSAINRVCCEGCSNKRQHFYYTEKLSNKNIKIAILQVCLLLSQIFPGSLANKNKLDSKTILRPRIYIMGCYLSWCPENHPVTSVEFCSSFLSVSRSHHKDSSWTLF